MTRTLVVGGTGPSGPSVVEGLLARGHDVTILHTGKHEVEFSRELEHIHADPNLEEPLTAALTGRTYDLAVCLYGRLRLVAGTLRDRTERLLAVGGVFYPGWVDGGVVTKRNGDRPPGPSYTWTRVPVAESTELEVSGAFAQRAVDSEHLLMEWHRVGHFSATMLRYPRLYGPRQPAPVEWSILRRALDRRPRLLVPDGGLLLETRLYSENAARMVLAAVDHPREAAGEVFNCGDAEPMTMRDWATVLAAAADHTFDLVSVPFDLASPAYAYARYPWQVCHRVLDISKARDRLDYQPVPALVALRRTAEYYLEHPLPRDGWEQEQLGDPFDYAREDELLARLDDLAAATALDPPPAYSHPYAHPPQPDTPVAAPSA